MSTWRAHFGFNKYLSITARATRQALKEESKVKAEGRAVSNLRFQDWDAGKAGEQTWMKVQEVVEEKPDRPAATSI